jgi:hypothetical protein
MPRTIRTVVENWSVTEVIDAEQSIYPRLGEAFEALKWWLSHAADSGEIIDDVNWLYMQDGDERANIPALVVVYTFDSYEVVLKHILVRIPGKAKNREGR